MAKKFEDMPPEVQSSVLKTIEQFLGNCFLDDAGDVVERVVSAYGHLYKQEDANEGAVLNITIVGDARFPGKSLSFK